MTEQGDQHYTISFSIFIYQFKSMQDTLRIKSVNKIVSPLRFRSAIKRPVFLSGNGECSLTDRLSMTQNCAVISPFDAKDVRHAGQLPSIHSHVSTSHCSGGWAVQMLWFHEATFFRKCHVPPYLKCFSDAPRVLKVCVDGHKVVLQFILACHHRSQTFFFFFLLNAIPTFVTLNTGKHI